MGHPFITVMSTIYVVAIILVVYHRNIEGLEKLVGLPGAPDSPSRREKAGP